MGDENKQAFIKSYLSFIDNGHFFRKPFSWLYIFLAAGNLFIPIVIFFTAVKREIFEASVDFVIVFLLVWLIIAFVSWVSAQLWWDRKTKLTATSVVGDEFVATPVFSHFIQTLGEWVGTWIGIVGFFVALLSTIILGDKGNRFVYNMDLSFLATGFQFVILWPICGFLIIVITRFLAEQIRALSSIANNTRRN
jgi:glycosyltransferase involved in cell wall biosynthesis